MMKLEKHGEIIPQLNDARQVQKLREKAALLSVTKIATKVPKSPTFGDYDQITKTS